MIDLLVFPYCICRFIKIVTHCYEGRFHNPVLDFLLLYCTQLRKDGHI
jgi:hypothetical protein